MPDPVIYEKPESELVISASSREHTREFFIDNCPEEDQAEALVIANTPPVLGRLVRKQIRASRRGPTAWAVSVEYAPGERAEAVGDTGNAPDGSTSTDEPPEVENHTPLGAEWGIETTAQQAHITQAKETKYRRQAVDDIAWRIRQGLKLAAGETAAGVDLKNVGSAPDEYRAIGLTKDRVEGCEIYAPSLVITLTVTRFAVSLAYINAALYGLVGKTNKEPFYFFDAGEVLYLGCTGNFTLENRWRLTHKFACSPNQKGLTFGSGGTTVAPEVIEIPLKRGWEYLWVSYKWKEVAFPAPEIFQGQPAATETILMQVPHAVYVQRVYDEGDFNLLGVGGGRGPQAQARARQAARGQSTIYSRGATIVSPEDDSGRSFSYFD